MKASDDPVAKWRSKNAVEQMSADAAKDIAAQIASKQPTRTIEMDVSERMDKITADCIQSFLRMRDIKVTPTKFAEAVEMVYKLHREQLKTWPQEELVVLASFQNAIVAIEQLRMELI